MSFCLWQMICLEYTGNSVPFLKLHWGPETFSHWIYNKLKNTGSCISKFSSLLFPIYLKYCYAWVVLLVAIFYYIWMLNVLLHFATVFIIQPLMPYYKCICKILQIILTSVWKQNIYYFDCNSEEDCLHDFV